jgi:hypothetical protein
VNSVHPSTSERNMWTSACVCMPIQISSWSVVTAASAWRQIQCLSVRMGVLDILRIRKRTEVARCFSLFLLLLSYLYYYIMMMRSWLWWLLL